LAVAVRDIVHALVVLACTGIVGAVFWRAG
jgi:hypothetical protein